MGTLSGRKVVVTGAAQGIGFQIASDLAAAGADVAVLDVNRDGAEAAAHAIGAGAPGVRVVGLGCDVRDRADIVEARARLVASWGEADGLVNNAGIVHNAPALEVSPDQWEDVLAVNLTGAFYCSQVFGQAMVDAGGGAIVAIASMSGLIVNRPQPQASYNVSKAGVIMLTKSLAAEWARLGVRVNCVAPGYIRTAMTAENLETEMARVHWIDATPLGRAGSPADVAAAVTFLLSDASAFVTGSTLVVDGGYTVW